MAVGYGEPPQWPRQLAALVKGCIGRLARWIGKALLACAVIALIGVLATQRFRYANLEEAKLLKYRLTLKGAGLDFDVPLNYDHRAYLQNHRQWPRPPHGRQAVDYITIHALLPDLEPYTELNAAEFEKPGWGRVIRASTTHLPRVDWFYYFVQFHNPQISVGFLQGWNRSMDFQTIPGYPIGGHGYMPTLVCPAWAKTCHLKGSGRRE